METNHFVLRTVGGIYQQAVRIPLVSPEQAKIFSNFGYLQTG
jgi:hypothetical protein